MPSLLFAPFVVLGTQPRPLHLQMHMIYTSFELGKE